MTYIILISPCLITLEIRYRYVHEYCFFTSTLLQICFFCSFSSHILPTILIDNKDWLILVRFDISAGTFFEFLQFMLNLAIAPIFSSTLQKYDRYKAPSPTWYRHSTWISYKTYTRKTSMCINQLGRMYRPTGMTLSIINRDFVSVMKHNLLFF